MAADEKKLLAKLPYRFHEESEESCGIPGPGRINNPYCDF